MSDEKREPVPAANECLVDRNGTACITRGKLLRLLLLFSKDYNNILFPTGDVKSVDEGGDLMKYDAFLLFADADTEFANKVLDHLENTCGMQVSCSLPPHILLIPQDREH
jgi:hypothetical protein